MPARRPYEETAHRRAFGARVRQIRVARGWTQEELCERAEVHRSYLAAIETGGRNPTLDVIVRIAGGLRVPIADLFSLNDKD